MSQIQSSAKNLNLRAQVVKTLLAVQNGQSLTSVLNQHLNIVSERDRGLYHELSLGCLRQWYSLKAITLPLLTKPLDNEALESCLYLVSFYARAFLHMQQFLKPSTRSNN